MSSTWDETEIIAVPATPTVAFPDTLKEHDTEDAQGRIMGSFGTSQGQTTAAPHMGVQTFGADEFQKENTRVEAILSDTGVILVRNSSAKATFNNRILDNTQPRQILPYDPNRRIARLWVTVAQPVLIGPESELNNYVGATALTGALVAGVSFLPGLGTLPFVFEYTGISELWAIAATSTASALSSINETYGGGAGIG